MTMSRMLGSWPLPALLVFTVFAVAGAELPLFASGTPSHVRVIDQPLAELIDSSVATSVTFRTIVSRLESAPLLVFVRCRTRQEQAQSAAGLEFLANTPAYRYLRVFVRCDLPAAVQAPLLAHEFQHAVEVADAPDIVDAASLRLHYQRIGYRSNADDRAPSFDTTAAIDVQRRVASELARTAPHTIARLEAPLHVWR